MSEETPTLPEENKKTFQQHTDDVLDLQTAAEASRRYQGAQEQARQDAREDSTLREPGEPGFFNRHPHLTTAGVTAGLVGIAAVGVTGIISSEGGTSNGVERGVVNNSIESLTLNPDANIRLDPYVSTGDNNNNALHLGAKVTIDANHDIRVLTDTNNGTWYGIPIAEVKAVAPRAGSINDKDGILWVNEQGVEKVETTQLSTE